MLCHKLLARFLLISLVPLMGMSLIGFATACNVLETLRAARAGQPGNQVIDNYRGARVSSRRRGGSSDLQ